MATTWQQNYQIYKRYVRNLALIYQKRQDIKLFVELLLTLSVVIIFAVFAIRPTIITIIGLNKDIEGRTQTRALLDAKIEALSSAQALYDNNIAAIRVIDAAVPDNPFPVVFARQVEGLAKRHGLLIVGFNTQNVPLVAGIQTTESAPIPVDPTAPVDSFPPDASSFLFGINLLGDYVPITDFLREFENLRTPMYQDSFDVQVSQGDLPGQIMLSISGRLAYLPNE